MPDKHGDKKKNDPKEQRKPRGPRNQSGRVEKKTEKHEEIKTNPKVSVPQKPPVYEDPGPEFYKNLKRETDEIIKITEEENSKYKKKEIQSNWAKYEMPIESYDETEEQDIGADYDKLIQMPLSVGGHFQFKHEKSWDTTTGPSPYDKYFEINYDSLATAVSTVPFYERNQIDNSLFSDTEIVTMDNRATKYKQKYFNDKKYSTPETEAQDRILNLLKNDEDKINSDFESNLQEKKDEAEDIVLECDSQNTIEDIKQKTEDNHEFRFKVISKENEDIRKELENISIHETKTIDTVIPNNLVKNSDSIPEPSSDIQIESEAEIFEEIECVKSSNEMKISKTKEDTAAPKTNPVIESPEDLEKWLDDFLDG